MKIIKSHWKIILVAVLLILAIYAVIKFSHSYLTGTVIDDNGVLVLYVDEADNETLVGEKLSIKSLDDFQVGEQVIVEYDGGVMESSPPQIKALSIRKAD